MQRVLVLSLLAAATISLPACGGAGANKSWNAMDELPARASTKAQGHAERCDDGVLKSCQWMGIWYAVGGGGPARRHFARKYFNFACNEGLNSSCKLMNNTGKLAALGDKMRAKQNAGGGGARTGGGGIQAAAKLPGNAPQKIVGVANQCDAGEMKSCHALSAWYMLGGAGKDKKIQGLAYTAHACKNGYQPACELIEKLKQKLRERKQRQL